MLSDAEQRRENERRQRELTEQLIQMVDTLKVDTYNNLTGEGRWW